MIQTLEKEENKIHASKQIFFLDIGAFISSILFRLIFVAIAVDQRES